MQQGNSPAKHGAASAVWVTSGFPIGIARIACTTANKSHISKANLSDRETALSRAIHLSREAETMVWGILVSQ